MTVDLLTCPVICFIVYSSDGSVTDFRGGLIANSGAGRSVLLSLPVVKMLNERMDLNDHKVKP